jgi:hypothetical protein
MVLILTGKAMPLLSIAARHKIHATKHHQILKKAFFGVAKNCLISHFLPSNMDVNMTRV